MDSYSFGDFVLKFDDENHEAFAYKFVDLDSDELDTEQIHDFVYGEDDDEDDCGEDHECL
jgi:hypothetical protein